MVLLQSQHTADIFQFLSQLFHDLKQSVHESTLWVCDHGVSQPFSLELQETETLLILKLHLHCSSRGLDLQITPETVLVRGERPDLLPSHNHAKTDSAARFQSLIPLPISTHPQSAIAELNGTTLTLTLMKSYEAQRTAKITVGDRGQWSSCVIAISTESVSASAEFN